jgi:hypothetical protein
LDTGDFATSTTRCVWSKELRRWLRRLFEARQPEGPHRICPKRITASPYVRVLRSRCLAVHLRPRPPRRQVLHYMCVPPPIDVRVRLLWPVISCTIIHLSFSPISHPACRVCHAGPLDGATLLARRHRQTFGHYYRRRLTDDRQRDSARASFIATQRTESPAQQRSNILPSPR